MNIKAQVLGMTLASAMSMGAVGNLSAADPMSIEEAAAELQQTISLDADITQAVDASVKDGKIVLIGSVADQQAMDKIESIISDMELDSELVDNQVVQN